MIRREEERMDFDAGRKNRDIQVREPLKVPLNKKT